jgi:hypothetical protein
MSRLFLALVAFLLLLGFTTAATAHAHRPGSGGKSGDGQPALTDKDLETLWTDLADADAEKAFKAMGKLIGAPAKATPYIKTHLKPVPSVDPQHLQQLVEDLGDAKFPVRDKATAELEKLAHLARPALEKRLAAKPTLEVRKRIEGLLAKLDGPVTRPDELRGLRAVEVLERIGSPEAKQVLEVIAAGAPGALVTEDARAAVGRLKAVK